MAQSETACSTRVRRQHATARAKPAQRVGPVRTSPHRCSAAGNRAAPQAAPAVPALAAGRFATDRHRRERNVPDQAAVALRDERRSTHRPHAAYRRSAVRTGRLPARPRTRRRSRGRRVGLAGTLIAQRDDLDRCVRIEHHSDQPIQRRALRNTRIHETRFTPAFRVPAHRDRAMHTLHVRHQHREAAIGRRDRRDAGRRSVRLNG